MFQRRIVLTVLSLLVSITETQAFAVHQPSPNRHCHPPRHHFNHHRSCDNDNSSSTSRTSTEVSAMKQQSQSFSFATIERSAFLSMVVASTLLLSSTSLPSWAEDDLSPSTTTATTTTTTTTRTIEGCPKPIQGKPNNCIATSNIKQLDTYSPPWTFEVTPEEAFARLKGLIASDPSLAVQEVDESGMYIKASTKRSSGTSSVQDVIEFLVKGDDRVVVFRSYEAASEGSDDGGDGVVARSSIPDFGANRKRCDELRKKSGGVFDLMGAGLTADSFEGGAAGKRNGALGQLKAFYGLQSGEGYQYVFED